MTPSSEDDSSVAAALTVVKNGWDTFERLNSINPLLPIIIIAVRPNQSALAEAAGVAALMEKPLAIQIPS